MQEFKKVMIGLDFTGMDKHVLSYASFFCDLIRPETIYFVHVEKDEMRPQHIDADLLKAFESMDDAEKRKMKEEVLANFGGTGAEVVFDVLEGQPIEELLVYSKEKDIDLFITGRKKQIPGAGILPEKIAGKSACSILFVPEKAPKQVNNVVVPSDFSKNSLEAFNTAIAIAGDEATRFHCLHVYSLPSGFYKTGKTKEEFAEIMLQNAKKECSNFISSVKCKNMVDAYICDEERGDPANEILDYASKENADLLVLGSRGKSRGASLLLGSVAEKLMKLNADYPTLILKNKKESISFLDAILNLN